MISTTVWKRLEEERMNTIIKKIVLFGAIAAAVAGSVWFATVSMADDRYGVNIVSNGTWSHAAVKSAYNNSEIRAIYQKYGLGGVINATPVEGLANGHNNTVVVNGRVVATGAKTVQRRHVNIAAPSSWDSIGGKRYPTYHLSNSFEPHEKVQQAFVWLDKNGKFIAAIAKDCGNPVWGNPTPPPAPKPQPPKPPVPTPQPPKPQPKPEPKPQPVLTCDMLSAELVKGTRNTYKFTVKATTKHGASIERYSFNFGDGKGAVTANATVNHTYAKAGSYTVTVTVHGKEAAAVQKTSEQCKMTVTVAPEPIDACDLSTGSVVTIERSEFEKNQQRYTTDLAKCDKVTVCDKTTGDTVRMSKAEKERGGSRYGAESECVVEVCDTKTKNVIKVNIKDRNKEGYVSKDSEVCKPATPPVTPPTTPEPKGPAPVTPAPPVETKELARTGMTDTLISIIGLGSLTTAAAAYVVSRRQ